MPTSCMRTKGRNKERLWRNSTGPSVVNLKNIHHAFLSMTVDVQPPFNPRATFRRNYRIIPSA